MSGRSSSGKHRHCQLGGQGAALHQAWYLKWSIHIGKNKFIFAVVADLVGSHTSWQKVIAVRSQDTPRRGTFVQLQIDACPLVTQIDVAR